jgi:hypothetical protein
MVAWRGTGTLPAREVHPILHLKFHLTEDEQDIMIRLIVTKRHFLPG